MNIINIKVTASFLFDLCEGKLTYEACEAIVDYLADCCGANESFYLADILISFAEVPANYRSDYPEDEIIAELRNGNIVVAQ